MEELNYNQPSSSLQTQSDLYLEEFFKQAKKRLTDEDYLLLLYLSDGEYTVKDIAALMQVSLSVIYDRKERIQKRLEGIKNCLKRRVYGFDLGINFV